MQRLLSEKQIEEWKSQGFLYLRNFYDLSTEIEPIQREVHALLSIFCKKNKIAIEEQGFTPETFDRGLSFLVKNMRDEAARFYDLLKKIPSYVALAGHQKNIEISKELLNSKLIGFANRGYGIRLDHPQEDKFLTQLHQDYTSQLGSPNGVVFWSPLRRVTTQLGPVVIYPGSQKLGVLPIEKRGEGSYGLWIQNEAELRAKFTRVVPEVDVGDVVVMDYLTLHESSPNLSKETRWAMISRYFDFTEHVGEKYGWVGGLAEGNSFEKIHPELTVWSSEK